MSRRRARSVGPVIVGSGVAGLSAALALDGCVVVTDGDLGATGSSPLAQGGIAAAVGPADDPRRHRADTHAVGCGLTVDAVAAAVTDGGAAAVQDLVALGAEFDRKPSGDLALGREAGHTRRRIVHANGDGSGAAIMTTLIAAVRDRPDIEVVEHTQAVDLMIRNDGTNGVGGVLTRDHHGELVALASPAVVLATGGYAHCFGRTTTPSSSVGGGLAMAARAGTVLADLEFVQFHPTALDVETAESLPLLTEALRGEGAILVDDDGRRFMLDEHADAELAPRDVVARAIYRQVMAGRHPRLDCRRAIGDAIEWRFPTVFALARAHGFDPRTEALPVTPAAHYCMGGVATDHRGRTSSPGLWAVGELASTGLHGANRLASNSLLEGLVLGRVVGATLRSGPTPAFSTPTLSVPRARSAGPTDHRLVADLRALLWSAAGVERDEKRLNDGLAELACMAEESRHDAESRSIHTVATLVIEAALARRESRGAHFRLDAEAADPAQATRSFITPKPVDREIWCVVDTETSAPDLVAVG